MLNAVITRIIDGNTVNAFITDAQTTIKVKLARIAAPPQNPRDDQVTPADVSRLQLCQLASAKKAELNLIGALSELETLKTDRRFEVEFVGEVNVDQGGGSWINASDKMVELGAAVYVE